MNWIQRRITGALLFGVTFLGHVQAFASCPTAQTALDVISPVSDLSAPLAPGPVKVQFSLDRGLLTAKFEVRTPEIHASPILEPGINVYDQDAVEIFLSVTGDVSRNGSYFEFELSPYDNTLQVRINVVNGRKKFVEGIDFGMVHKATLRPEGDGWDGEITIPLAALGWQGRSSKIVGNAFAILGDADHRTYMALNLPAQKSARFHLPQHFVRLINCR